MNKRVVLRYAPGLIAGLILLLVVAANAGTKEKIGELLKAANAKGEFSGVVLIANGDRIEYTGAVGQANRQFNVANSVETRFRICSLTKQFTALLVMQLVEAGKIDLDKPISAYLPDFRKDTAAKVTVRDLLMNASGLPDLPDEFYVSEDAAAAKGDLVIAKYLQGEMQFEPGTRFNYSNGDFIVLGSIVERVSGRSFDQMLREKILEPLGMRNSGLLKNEDVVPNLASGYRFADGVYRNESFVQIQNFGSAGAMYSTAGDLLKWDRALLTNRLLSKRFTGEMFAGSPKLGFVALGSWSYKLKLADGKEHRIVERQGGINGFSILNVIMPDDGISAIFLGNVETQTLFQTYAGKGLSYDVLNTALGGKDAK